MNIAIISNGTIKDYTVIKEKITSEYEYIICADGGAEHARKMDIMPNLVLGDFDSLSKETLEYYRNLNVEIIEADIRKDDTDTQLAINYAIEKKADKVGLFACTGSRLDHTLGNINNLFKLKQNNIKASVIDDNNEIQIAEKKTKIEGSVGDTISLVSLSEVTKGITLTGFEYPLESYDLKRGNSIGISNVLSSKDASVEIEDGDLLIFKSKD